MFPSANNRNYYIIPTKVWKLKKNNLSYKALLYKQIYIGISIAVKKGQNKGESLRILN